MTEPAKASLQRLSAEIATAIEKGHYELTERGQQILDEGSAWVKLEEWTLLDAFANGYVDITEAGKQAHDEELTRSIRRLEQHGGRPASHGPEGYFFPEKNLNREWAAREMRYHLREAEKIRRYCAGEPDIDPVREKIADRFCSRIEVTVGNTQLNNTYRRVTFGFLNKLAWETSRGSADQTRIEAEIFVKDFKKWLRDFVLGASL